MTPVRIATWNLQRPKSSQGVRQSRLQEWFRRIAADVWVLTETHQQLKPGEDYFGCRTTRSDPDHSPGEAWTAIWSRYPLRPLGPTRDPARSVAAMLDLPDGASLLVYGTVLPWLGSPWNGHPSTGGQAFKAALLAQQTDWTELTESHPGTPLVLAGDLNQDLAGRHYYGSNSNREALRRALRSTGLDCLTANDSDPVARVSRGQRASVDHICVGHGLRQCAGTQPSAWPPRAAPDRSLSDHFGAVVDIEHEPSS